MARTLDVVSLKRAVRERASHMGALVADGIEGAVQVYEQNWFAVSVDSFHLVGFQLVY